LRRGRCLAAAPGDRPGRQPSAECPAPATMAPEATESTGSTAQIGCPERDEDSTPRDRHGDRVGQARRAASQHRGGGDRADRQQIDPPCGRDPSAARKASARRGAVTVTAATAKRTRGADRSAAVGRRFVEGHRSSLNRRSSSLASSAASAAASSTAAIAGSGPMASIMSDRSM